MINPFITKARIAKKYGTKVNSVYANNYFTSLASIYSFVVEDDNELDEVVTLSSFESELSKVLFAGNYYRLMHDLTQIIGYVMSGIIEYGRIYMELRTEEINDENGCTHLSSIIPFIIYGDVKGITNNSVTLYSYNFNSRQVTQRNVLKTQLVKFDLKDIGLKRNYFSKILKRITRSDITKVSTSYIEGLKEYDFSYHSRMADIERLRLTKNIGWVFNEDKLSDSQILYRKIRLERLRIQILDYIIETFNNGLLRLKEKDVEDINYGKVISNTRRIDYDDLWKKYSVGEITASVLSSILYK